jgi:hypothetical protein
MTYALEYPDFALPLLKALTEFKSSVKRSDQKKIVDFYHIQITQWREKNKDKETLLTPLEIFLSTEFNVPDSISFNKTLVFFTLIIKTAEQSSQDVLNVIKKIENYIKDDPTFIRSPLLKKTLHQLNINFSTPTHDTSKRFTC